jgi:hypothetical protein
MDPAALAGRLQAIEDRLAGSDAERRAAAMCAAELRKGGRRPRTRTLWIRPQRWLPRALYATVGVAGSLVSVSHAEVGLGLAAGALLATVLEATGIPVVALLQTRRATQNVVAAPPADRGRRALLVLTAAADAPRDSVIARLERRGAPRWLPGTPGLLVVGLAGVAGCAGARMAGAEGTALGIVQLLPSALLIVLLGAFLEAGLAAAERGASAAGPAVALATAAALDAQPPRALAVEVVIAGAGEAGAAGMADYVSSRRRDLDPEDVVVIHLGASAGAVRYVVSDGEHVPFRLHPRLIELAGALPGTKPRRARGRSAARVARGARWPAIALEGDPRPLAAATLRLIAAIDRELLKAREH